jgi:hypothetical protein
MKQRRVPIRMCVVCRETSDKRSLLRVVRTSGENPRVVFDPTGKANGRGAYVCAAQDCIEKAVKQKRFERSLNVNSVPDSLTAELLAAVPRGDDAPLPTGVKPL